MRNPTRSLQIFFWSFAFIYVVLGSLQITQVDLWWQLTEGEHILHSWKLPDGPAVAFGLPALPYFDEYAGYEVCLALLYKIGGFPGLWFIFIAVYLAIIFLPNATSKQRYPAFDFSSTFAMLFCGILMKQRLEQRPELVAGLFLALLMVILRQSRLETVPRKTLAALFFLFLAWTNTHSTFVIGLFLLGLWIACEVAKKFRKAPVVGLLRNGAVMAGVTLLATMLNPYGPRRLLFPLTQVFDPGSTALSVEMWPITDLTTVAAILVLIEVGLLAWGLLTTRGVPPWIMVFSVLSVFISFKSYRFINLLAISVLFVYAERREPLPTQKPQPFLALRLLKDVALSLLCVFFIFGDAFSFLFTYQEMRTENRLAVHTRRFAPELCAMPQAPSGGRVPVLCGHGTGSFLTFDGNSQCRPMLDSGLSHFSSDTKRFFFFLWHQPAALELALQDLHVNYVILNIETFSWTPTIHRLRDWQLVACDANGMLWKRSSGDQPPLSSAQRAEVEDAMNQLQRGGKITAAFDCSTVLDNPSQSLDILEQFNDHEMTEAFFNHFCAWVDSLPPETVAAYLAREHLRAFPLIDAILSARLGPAAFDKFVASNPPGRRDWFWHALEVQNCLLKGDQTQARAIFDSISPAPIASVTYYRLWHEVHNDPASLGAYGQWQTWDDGAKQSFESMSVRLNDRITALDQPPGS